ncbi:phosphatidylinositol phosphate synthase [Longispora sp. NPDC051575]|uniref:phosphatidylinositol phosphate synthase n=1 Tax=Longispora sp. NPDC051575 TaxID=3154943 RepID=UPI00344529FF
MAKLLSVFGRARLARVLDPVGSALVRAGISPNTVTVAGTLGVVLGCVGFVARGHFLVGLVIVTLSCLTDLIDGAMARAKGTASRFGAFLDSTMDRVADGAIFGALAYWFGTTGHPWPAAAALLALVLGQVVSYAKARAEGLGMTCNVGIAERPERLILIGIGGLLAGLGVPYGLDVVLWLLVALSGITVWQRIAHVYRQAS